MLVGACGLTKREKYVADTNAQIKVVYEKSEELAQAIYQVPDEPTGPESFSELIATYNTYRAEVDELNTRIHDLVEVVPELADHLRESYDPEVSEALNHCDAAVDVFAETDATEEDYQVALTGLCLCIERFAEAVTAVSREYARVAG